jgi:hypothetical protein
VLLSVFGFAQHGHRTTSTWWARNNRTPTSTYAANYSIVTETGNNNSATIQQTGDKHVSEVTQDGLNYGFGAIKTKRLSLSLVKTKSSNRITWRQKMAKIVQKIDSI